MVDLAAPNSVAGWRSPLRSGRIRPGAIAGLVALGLSVFLLFALGVVIAVNQNGLRSRFGWIQHTDDVLLQVASLEQELQRMESNIRGYGLSGDPGHVGNWVHQKTDSEARLTRLAALMTDNSVQEARLAVVRPLIESWTARWSVYAAHPAPAGLGALRENLARDLREHPARRFHSGLNALAAVERTLLIQREEEAERLTTRLEWLSVLLALAAPSLGMVGISLLLREGARVRQREMQLQLEHSQRLGLMGETASMIAHELNQPLSAARTYLSVARRGQEGAQAEVIGKAELQIGRAAAILQRLRSFIEKRDDEWQPETCAGLVADALALLGTIDSSVMLHTDVETGLPVLMVDRIQIQQVLVNLMRNAIEAMAGSPRREMWLTVARAEDGRVLFCLRDSGPGLAPAVAQRLFQPFTSTKQEGMGIGLSICRRILQGHGGDIWAESPAEGGTRFCFALPVKARV